MAKPPVDADPEKFIMGRGVYDNLRTATPYQDDGVFRIDPCPMPVWSMVVFNFAFATFFYAFHWVVKQGQGGPWAVYVVPIGICVATCVVFTLVTYSSFYRARHLGPWLIYDKSSGRVTLPRVNVRFDRDEIVCVQYITTKRLDWDREVNNDRLSELNLITHRGGERKRWPLLRSIANVKAFDWLLTPLLENTDLPVVRVEDEWVGWQVTEKPYRRSAKQQ